MGACAGAEEQAGHGITIGFAVSTLDNPFFAAMKDGVETAAAELGATVVVVSACNDAAAQVPRSRKEEEVLSSPGDDARRHPRRAVLTSARQYS